MLISPRSGKRSMLEGSGLPVLQALVGRGVQSKRSSVLFCFVFCPQLSQR